MGCYGDKSPSRSTASVGRGARPSCDRRVHGGPFLQVPVPSGASGPAPCVLGAPVGLPDLPVVYALPAADGPARGDGYGGRGSEGARTRPKAEKSRIGAFLWLGGLRCHMRSKALKVVRPVTEVWGAATTGFWTAASDHVFVSLFVVFATAYVFPGSVTALFLAVVGLLAFDLVKEYVVDPRLEAGEDIQTGTVDLAFYMAGLVVAFVLLAAIHAGIGRPY